MNDYTPLTDLEDSRDRTYYSCWNDAHEGLVRQTYFTGTSNNGVKCFGCGAVMTYGRYTSEVESGWFKVNKAGVFESEVRLLDNIQMKFVMKIQNLIKRAPLENVGDLEKVLDDYLFKRIDSLGDLKNAILELASKLALHL